MNEVQLEAFIRSLEPLAAERPKAYRFRVLMLAVLGYAYLFLVIGFLLALIFAIPTLVYNNSISGLNYWVLKIIWIPVVLIWLVLRSLWITLPVPEGMELDQSNAPPLFALITEIREALQGPKVDHVLLADDFNAGIVQIPAFGMFGWLRNYLVIGLPLLQALTPEEFRSVLAHEFGHLSGKHSKFRGWIYRVRLSWLQILIRVKQERSYASFLFEPFLNWYAPYLNAYSFVLARAQEREADQYSIELAGRHTAARALSRLTAKERQLEEDFWPTFISIAKNEPQAPRDPFSQMLSRLRQPLDPARAHRWFHQMLRVPTSYDDTHPALVDRLAAMGYAKDGKEIDDLIAALADDVEVSAASVYLTSLPQDTEGSFDRLLREQIARPWHESHKEYANSRKRLETLEEMAQTKPLTIDEEWERATLTAQVYDEATSVSALQRVLEQDPKHARAHHALGIILLEQQNPDGIPHLEEAMKLEPARSAHAFEQISGFYFEQGNRTLADDYRKKAEESLQQQVDFQKQALNFSRSDRFEPHELDEALLANLRQYSAGLRGLTELYIVRRSVENVEGFHYVVGVTVGYTWQNGVSERNSAPIVQSLATSIRLPSYGVFVALEGDDYFLLDIFRKIPGALIYTSEGTNV